MTTELPSSAASKPVRKPSFLGWRERCGGMLLLIIMVPLAIVGYLLIVVTGSFWKTSRARAGVRALDHFVNASVFNGYAWESVSSHAWRERHCFWARVVIAVTDLFQKGHCEKANRREQKVVDLVTSKGLDKQTIF